MKLGIYLNSQHPAGEDPARRLAETLEQVALIRTLGFDSIWAGEHHVTPGFHFFPQMAFLQRVAAEAEGLWVGSNVALLPLHNPVELAEIGAFLDLATGGRFLLGVGLGYRPEEYAVFGVKMAERVGRLTEGIEIVRRLWSDDHVSFRGRYWQLSDVSIRPRPLQSPHPPIIVGAQVEAAISRAAKIGDGWLIAPLPTLEELAAQIAQYAAARAAENRAPSPHVCRLLEVGCAADEGTALRRVAPFLLEKYKSYFAWGLQGLSLDGAASPETQLRRLAAHRFALGAPAEVADMLLAQHRAGVTHLSMRVSWPGMPQGDILAGIELIGREVLPKVRMRTQSSPE
jgi:alkanesulfonate monooxygenase SsuD/methylene tetrahydromethanopterin reductase-like flavin-dependent oxidoreductase (luciferase family)